jgi:predicted transcriptional regulator
VIKLLLNEDCVRDILIQIAKKPNDHSFIDDMEIRLKDKYNKETVFYALQILKEEGYIHADEYYGNNQLDFSVGNMTKKGLDLYSKIQNDDVWARVKQSLLKFGSSVSMSVLSSLATKAFLALL